MKTRLRSSIATRAAAVVAALLIGSAASAEPIGKVDDANGLLLARTATGSVKVLVVGSRVEQGETLFTRENTYVQISLTDRSSVALGPDTELNLETYSFHETGAAAGDSATLKLLRGRVRVSSGILGARHPGLFTLAAGDTTIDIGRSTFIAAYIPPPSNDLARQDLDPLGRAPAIADSGTIPLARPHAMDLTSDPVTGRYRRVSLHLAQLPPGPSNGSMNPGLYVQVLDGVINLSNGGGSQNFAAGQFGFTPSFKQPPVILPNNPGMQFNPPPSFSSTTGAQNGNANGKPGDVDCIVR